MRALVTGISGFIGSNIAKVLLDSGWEVNGIDLKNSANKEITFFKGNILNRDFLLKAIKGCDYVFHEAAITSPPEFEVYPEKGLKTNIIGTFNVLDLASKVGVKRAIIASSSSVYGNLGKKAREDMATINHTNLYPITKIMNEMTARHFSLRGELETISLRYFNTYGIGENSKGAYSSIIHKFIADMKRGKRPIIYGDGTQRRDFIYIKDVVKANIQAIKYGKSGEAYNVGTGKSLTFNEIYKIIAEEIGFSKKPIYIKNPLRSYQLFTQADISKAEKELRFKAKFDVRSGVRNILKMVAK